MSQPRYYQHVEVAAMFGVPVEAIRRRAIRKEIPHLRFGRGGRPPHKQ